MVDVCDVDGDYNSNSSHKPSLAGMKRGSSLGYKH